MNYIRELLSIALLGLMINFLEWILDCEFNRIAERQSLYRYQILRIHTNRQEITKAFIHCEWRLF